MNDQALSIWIETQPRLKSFIARYTKDPALADDIVQDVFLKVYSNLHQLKDPKSFSSWAYRIARNSITDHYRRKSRSNVLNEFEWESNQNSLNECAEYCVKEILNSLPEKYREALQFSDMENYSQVDLSKKLHISYSGAKSRVQRARQMLRERVAEKYLIETDRYGNVVVCKDKAPCNCPRQHSDTCS